MELNKKKLALLQTVAAKWNLLESFSHEDLCDQLYSKDYNKLFADGEHECAMYWEFLLGVDLTKINEALHSSKHNVELFKFLQSEYKSEDLVDATEGIILEALEDEHFLPDYGTVDIVDDKLTKLYNSYCHEVLRLSSDENDILSQFTSKELEEELARRLK